MGFVAATRSGWLTKIHAGDDTGVRAGAIRVEDLDCDKVDSLGNTKCPAANGARDVAAVAVLVRVL